MSALPSTAAVERSSPLAVPLRIAAESFDAAIIGGGFAGTVVAVQLARLAGRPLRIAMFDRAAAFGRGAAYSPQSDHCLLNVRAKAMGAFPDAEHDFLNWLRQRGYENDDPDLGERFVPRRLYGDYLCDLLDRFASGSTVVEQRALAVTALTPQADGFALDTACASRIFAKHVVLAIGNLPPGGFGEPSLNAAMREHARNPWEFLAGEPIDSAADVLIVGTGLSALDVLRQLAADEHRGRITMLSRHGRFPLPHAEAGTHAGAPLPAVSGSPAQVLHMVRRLVRDAEVHNGTWRDVVDALRPQVNGIWQSWSVEEQRRFFRHLAPMWEIHRHRAPQSTLDVRDALIAAGRLRALRGRLAALEPHAGRLRVTYADGDCRVPAMLEVDGIVDCTGPRRDIAGCGDQLIESLFAQRLARPGVHGIGFAATADGTLAGRGDAKPIFALGTPLRGTFCESSAVREIRVQALSIATAIAASLGAAAHSPAGRIAGEA